MHMNDKIDAVITWVDGNDVNWIKEKNLYASHSCSNQYYRDWGTVKYVLRGIESFMPWINRVHFVTWGHIPPWLNIECEKIHVVTHKDFFNDKSDLPVFNSNAIEANLHLIPKLSEKFVYFNDDTLVLKPTPRERFFQNELPLDFIVQSIPRKGFLYRRLRSNDVYVDIVLNELKLINSQFSKELLLYSSPDLFYSRNYTKLDIFKNFMSNCFWREYAWLNLYHHPQPYLKSALLLAHKLYGNILSETSKHRFRGRTDVSQYIYRDVQLASGRFIPYTPNDAYCLNIRGFNCLNKNRSKIEKMRFFCANDSVHLKKDEFEVTHKLLMDILDNILPNKSIFET